MSKFKPIPSTYLSNIDCPHCPKCNAPRMVHSKTEPESANFEYRTFDCQKCGRAHRMIISTDPLDFNTRGWIHGAA
jgi:hypothetical protein